MEANKVSLRIPENTEELYQMAMGMVNFTIHDSSVILTRKILTQEQFRNERIRRLASRHFVYEIEGMFTRVFGAMMNRGTLKKCDPQLLAFSFSAPISVLICRCDREPDKEAEVMERIEQFVRLFIVQYGI